VHIAVYLPLLASLGMTPPVAVALTRSLPDRLAPRQVVAILVSAMTLLALASTAALILLVANALAEAPRVAGPLGLSSRALSVEYPWATAIGVVAGIALLFVLARTAALAVHAARRRRVLGRDLSTGPRQERRPDTIGLIPGLDSGEGIEVKVVEDPHPYAVACPRLGRGPAQIITSTGMLEALTVEQRRALLAHELAHISGHHHLYLTVAAFATALNPLLGALRRDLSYAVERCADETAAGQVGDRTTAAHAIGRAALAVAEGRRAVGFPIPAGVGLLLSATAGPVPRRVAALLSEPCAPFVARREIVIAAALVLAGLLAGVAAVHATIDLAALLRAAETH
jgi:Zn-dependent protease with chaperone function